MKRLKGWVATHPKTVEFLEACVRHELRAGLFSGTHAYLYGVRDSTEDIDLFTHPDDFASVCSLLPGSEVSRNKVITMHDSQGEPVTFLVDELNMLMDGVALQMLRPRSNVLIGTEEYDLSLTDLAASRLQVAAAGCHRIPLANVVDTELTRMLFQRADGKHDAPDLAGLAASNTPEDRAYLF